jgi:hypothetical protein
MEKDLKKMIDNAKLDVHMVLGFYIWNDIQDIEQKENFDVKTMSKSLIERYRQKEEKASFSVGGVSVNFIDLYDENPELYHQVIMEECTNEFNKRFEVTV